jgi:hypothetical protein
MIYARRDTQGRITAISLIEDAEHPEAIADDAAELAAFQAATGKFLRSDLALARVLEDLMEVLIDKAVIRFTDLPVAAQNKLLARQAMRRGVNLLGDSDTV